jgi:type III secretion system low calcium response chaperone LcrH/SycD
MSAVAERSRAQLREAGSELRAAMGFPEELLGPAYRHGVSLYEHGRYAEAEKVFLVLVACDVTNHRVWKSLASARKMAGRHADAVAAYEMASKTGSPDPWVPVHAAECLLHLKRHGRAVAALRHAFALSEFAPTEAPALRQRIAALLAGLERTLPEATN